MNQPWKIDDGLKLIRALQGQAKTFGYHIALGGGVLNNGTSDKDLDLYFLPFNNPKVAKDDVKGLLAWLTGLWGEPEAIGNYTDTDVPVAPSPNRLPSITRQNGQWVIERVPPEPPQFRVPVQFDPLSPFDPVANDPFPPQSLGDAEWVANLNPKKKKIESSYKYKLKFHRVGEDRIDVFVI